MKKFFRVALVCALAGATLLYTGCTKDYSEDLNSLQKLVEEQGNTIKTQGQSIENLLRAIDELTKADSLANDLIGKLTKRADSLDGLVAELTREKNRLDSLIGVNAGNIATLQDSVKTIDSLLADVIGKANALRADVDTLKGRVSAHDTLLANLQTELKKKADSVWVQTELDKKADISWVKENYATTKALLDTAAALRVTLGILQNDVADIKGNLADVTERLAAVADSVADNDAAIKKIMNEVIPPMLADIDTLQDDMTQAKKDIKRAQHVADSAATLAGDAWDYAHEVKDWVVDNYYKKTTVDQLLAQLEGRVDGKLAKKLDITTWAADTARINAKFREIDSLIVEVIEDYQEQDSLLNEKIDSLDRAIQDALGAKVDTTTFNEFVEAVWKKFGEVDIELNKLIGRVQSIVYVPEYDDDRITLNWAQMKNQNQFDTRNTELPASFDKEGWAEFWDELYGQVPAELEQELSELEAFVSEQTGAVIHVEEPFTPAIGLPINIGGQTNDYSFWAATPIVEPTHVKYRIYGIDPATTVDRLIELVNEGQDVLSFDVVRVLTRVNRDNVALNITHAEKDDLFTDGSVIDLTVVPEGLPNDFWLYTWDVKNFMNPRLHSLYYFVLSFLNKEISPALYNWLYQQMIENVNIPDIRDMLKADGATQEPAADVEEDTVFPAFSVSLVLEDVTDTTSRMITSAYNNVVPAAKADMIDLWIKRDDKDITYKRFADTVSIPYNDLAKYEVLDGTTLMVNFKGTDYTVDEFAALGMNLGEPQARFFATSDFSESIAARYGHDLPPDYFVNTADDEAPVAYAQLKDVNPEGVFAKEFVELRYFLGPGFCYTTCLVKVIPVTIDVVCDIVESETVTPITWNYKDDAPVDASIFNGNTNLLYSRDSALASYDKEKVEADFAGAGIELADFEGKVPVDSLSYLLFFYEDAEGNVTKDSLSLRDLLALQAAATEDAPVFNIYPWFTEDGVLMARLDNFVFNDLSDDERGALTKIEYLAVYSLPDDAAPAIQVNVTGKILFDDRDRTPIVITLPTTKEDYFVNFATTGVDSLYNEAGELVPTVETSFEAHHLTPADVQDAFGQVESKHWDDLNDPPFTGGVADRNVLYGKNFIWDSENPQGDPSLGGYYYVENERIDSITNTTRPIDAPAGTEFETATTLVRNNTTAHINTEYNAADVARVIFNTYCNYNSYDLRNMEIIPNTDMTSYLTLWYGQDVIVKKRFEINTDGIYDFESINTYVKYVNDNDVYSELQPEWTPWAVTNDYSLPLEAYNTQLVTLNRNFRIVDIKTGENCTDNDGLITEDYSFLRRRFWLEDKAEDGSYTSKVIRIDDPRIVTGGPLADSTWAQNWAVTIDNEINADTEPNQEANVVSYLSMAPQTNVYGDLLIRNDNGSFVRLTTRFDRPAANLKDLEDKTVAQTYANFVLKLWDPLKELKPKNDDPVQKVNINNSMEDGCSIYEFLTLKDKRDWELIEGNGWVVGNGENGFADGKKVNEVYDLHFNHSFEYLTNTPEETKAHIHFNEETGLITFDSSIQSQIQEPIRIKLDINIEYPWGTRNTDANPIIIEFINIPVGDPSLEPQTPETPAEP